MRSSF